MTGRSGRANCGRSPTGSPENSDGTYRGEMPAAEGLIQSRNTMSVRVGDYAGLANIQRVASAVGLGDIPSQPSIYLGAFEETLRDVTAAYTVFPNEGVRKQAYIVERIDDADGQVLYRAAHVTAPAIERRAHRENDHRDAGRAGAWHGRRRPGARAGPARRRERRGRPTITRTRGSWATRAA